MVALSQQRAASGAADMEVDDPSHKFRAPQRVKQLDPKTPPRQGQPKTVGAETPPPLSATQPFSPPGKSPAARSQATQPPTQEYSPQQITAKLHPKAPLPTQERDKKVTPTPTPSSLSSVSSATMSLDDETQVIAVSPLKQQLQSRIQRDRSGGSSSSVGFGSRADESDSFELNSDFGYDFSQNCLHPDSAFTRQLETQIVEQEPKYSNLSLRESESPLAPFTQVQVPVKINAADYESAKATRAKHKGEESEHHQGGGREETLPAQHPQGVRLSQNPGPGEFSQFVDSFTQEGLDNIGATIDDVSMTLPLGIHDAGAHATMSPPMDMTLELKETMYWENMQVMERVDKILKGSPLAPTVDLQDDENPLSSPLESPPFRAEKRSTSKSGLDPDSDLEDNGEDSDSFPTLVFVALFFKQYVFPLIIPCFLVPKVGTQRS